MMSETPTATVGTVMLDCSNPDVLVEFWGQVLGIEEKARYPNFVWMSRMSDGGPALAFQVVPEKKSVKNRMHLDLTVEDREAFAEFVLSLGGNRVADHEVEGFHWTVMADPEGNEFCIVAH
jgi:catechol 2,3-dioxygenase-like lactoylglutathione lyase family enzyme